MKKVLVTGVSGYVGLNCAVELLKNGYAVRGSVRSLSKTKQLVNNIKKEVDPKGSLEFCELDLLKDNGWAEAMEGCDYVLHVASPFMSSEPKDENELIKPTIEGTQRALKAAKKANVKRLVLTSSMATMMGDFDKSLDIDQNSWTNPNSKHTGAYIKSKTLAEKSAWDFINKQTDDSKLELVVINPGGIFGPTLSNKISGESTSMYERMISGKVPMIPQISMNLADVRDVATVHVKALENDEANGKRFIVGSEKPHALLEMAKILKANGYDKVSTRKAPNFLMKFMANFNGEAKGTKPFIGKTFAGDVSETMRVFNWKPIPLEKTVLDAAKSIKALL